eukprot:366366-Chlamydomonas_euryale.AAC.3
MDGLNCVQPFSVTHRRAPPTARCACRRQLPFHRAHRRQPPVDRMQREATDRRVAELKASRSELDRHTREVGPPPHPHFHSREVGQLPRLHLRPHRGKAHKDLTIHPFALHSCHSPFTLALVE